MAPKFKLQDGQFSQTPLTPLTPAKKKFDFKSFFPKFEFEEAGFVQTPLTPLTPAKKKMCIQILSLAPKFKLQDAQLKRLDLSKHR